MIQTKETIKYRRALAQIVIAIEGMIMDPDDRRHILYLIDSALEAPSRVKVDMGSDKFKGL